MTVAGFTGTGSQLIPGGVQQMKRRIAVVALVFVAFALIAQQAFADSPHFIRASGSLNNDGSLTVDFKEAGLGTNQNINYELTANASATYVCVSSMKAEGSSRHARLLVGGRCWWPRTRWWSRGPVIYSGGIAHGVVRLGRLNQAGGRCTARP
jgi:hypothetical protein